MEFTVKINDSMKGDWGQIEVCAGQLDLHEDYWRIISTTFLNKKVVLVYNQTNSGAYCSTPDPKLAKEYNLEDYTGKQDIIRSFMDNGHGEGATNLIALARLLEVTDSANIALSVNYV